MGSGGGGASAGKGAASMLGGMGGGGKGGGGGATPQAAGGGLDQLSQLLSPGAAGPGGGGGSPLSSILSSLTGGGQGGGAPGGGGAGGGGSSTGGGAGGQPQTDPGNVGANVAVTGGTAGPTISPADIAQPPSGGGGGGRAPPPPQPSQSGPVTPSGPTEDVHPETFGSAQDTPRGPTGFRPSGAGQQGFGYGFGTQPPSNDSGPTQGTLPGGGQGTLPGAVARGQQPPAPPQSAEMTGGGGSSGGGDVQQPEPSLASGTTHPAPPTPPESPEQGATQGTGVEAPPSAGRGSLSDLFSHGAIGDVMRDVEGATRGDMSSIGRLVSDFAHMSSIARGGNPAQIFEGMTGMSIPRNVPEALQTFGRQWPGGDPFSAARRGAAPTSSGTGRAPGPMASREAAPAPTPSGTQPGAGGAASLEQGAQPRQTVTPIGGAVAPSLQMVQHSRQLGTNTPPTVGFSQHMKNLRAPLMNALRDPGQRLQVAAMLYTEDARDPVGPMESFANRIAMTGWSPSRMLHSGFYGPINHGQLGAAMRELRNNPHLMDRMNIAIDTVGSGSNILGGATDQGSPGDPNYNWPGGRVIRGHEVYNDWGGFKGHGYARRWREEQQARVRDELRAPPDASADYYGPVPHVDIGRLQVR